MRDYVVCPKCGRENLKCESELMQTSIELFRRFEGTHEITLNISFYCCNHCRCSYTHISEASRYKNYKWAGYPLIILVPLFFLLFERTAVFAVVLETVFLLAQFIFILFYQSIEGMTARRRAIENDNGFLVVGVNSFDEQKYKLAFENEYPDIKYLSPKERVGKVLFLYPAPNLKCVLYDYELSGLKMLNLNYMYELRYDGNKRYAQLADYNIDNDKIDAEFKVFDDMSSGECELFSLDGEVICKVKCC